MGVLRDRLVLGDGPPRLRSNDRPAQDLVELCESNVGMIEPGKSFPWQPVDLMAAVAVSALGDDEAQGPSLTQTAPARPRLADAIGSISLARLFPGARRPAVLALAAGMLQIHDFWDPSHDAAQEADNQGEKSTSPYWHGIAHRREPDAGNAAYWFRRVGRHPSFEPLAAIAQPLLDTHAEATLTRQLISGGGWNPFGMIDLCTQARPGSAREILARRLQRAEMWLLLEESFAAVAGQ
jgi:hypothetical protein